MARFDVYANPDASERKITPYLVDVQNDYISGLATRVVIPMRKQAHFGPLARNLNPVFDTAALSAVPATELRKVVLNLHNAREPIQEALDTLFGSS
jgi:toxin CcdB